MLDDLLLPPATRLIHVGPHKTGTTAVQWAMHDRRAELHQQHVHYAWHTIQAYLPAIGLTGRRGRRGGPRQDERHWLQFVDEVREAGDQRVVASSESFANANKAQVRRLVEDLGPDHVHVVRMVRRYDKMLASQWQQTIAAGGVHELGAWLEQVSNDPSHGFWRRHGFARQTRKWVDVLGPDRVSVVVVAEHDREWLLRVFEAMLGLRPGTLELDSRRGNRSLTMAEVEVVRRVNQALEEHGWVDETHFHYVRRGVSTGMRDQQVDPEGGRIEVPAHLHPMIEDATRRDLASLRKLGTRLVGDPAWLAPAPGPNPDSEAGHATTPSASPVTAAGAVAGVVRSALEIEKPFPLRPDGALPDGPPAASSRLGEEFRTGRSVPDDAGLAPAVAAALRELGRLADAEEWDQSTWERFVDEGAAAWLLDADGAADPASRERLAPALVARAVVGAIVAADPGRP